MHELSIQKADLLEQNESLREKLKGLLQSNSSEILYRD